MNKCRLYKKEHLRFSKEILNVFNNGTQVVNKYLKFFFLKNNKNYNRFTIVINKKFGKAVIRNKSKRQLREVFRTNKDKLKKGYDMIFFIKNEFSKLQFQKKKEVFFDLIRRADLLEGNTK